jgi:hypothetical protein
MLTTTESRPMGSAGYARPRWTRRLTASGPSAVPATAETLPPLKLTSGRCAWSVASGGVPSLPEKLPAKPKVTPAAVLTVR